MSKRDISVTDQMTSCAVCARTLLKGESAELFLTTAGEVREVCDLCRARVEAQGWIPSSQQEAGASAEKDKRNRGIRGWFGRREKEERRQPAQVDRSADQEEPQLTGAFGEFDPEPDVDLSTIQRSAQLRRERDAYPASRPQQEERAAAVSQRRIRGVPVEDEGKLARGVELFNLSQHPRTVVGIARSLGDPMVSVGISSTSPNEVELLVAWELSWYQYAIDIGDRDVAVHLRERGSELEELSEQQKQWNAVIATDGTVTLK